LSGIGLGFDESVYVSQVTAQAPAAFFSAPRARGISLLVAPVTLWTSQVWVMRAYLAVLSSATLLAAFWLWRPLRGDRLLAVAAALFTTLWITLFYGPTAMPNLWVALCGLAAVGCFLRAAGNPADRLAHAVLGAAIAVASLMRPSDAVWLSIPMVVALLLRRAWRRASLAGVLFGGLAVGLAPWVVESYLRYGGLVSRLRQSGQVEGGFGLHFPFVDQLKSQSGLLLCRPCTGGWNHPVTSIWLLLLALLVAASAVVAARTRRGATEWLPLACAATAATPYLVLVDYAAPRFLLPTYALLAIPIADLSAAMIRAVPPARRPAIITLVAVCLAAHLSIQYAVAWHTVRKTAMASQDRTRIAYALHRVGIRAPCLVTGDQDIPIGFAAGCQAVDVTGNNANTTTQAIVAASAHEPVAVLVKGLASPPAYAARWRSELVPGLADPTAVRIYFRPR
jgi:Glycosyltransferase family 87